ncbi:hypothetical protein ABKN59_011282 [Abortiporus biennis]
MTSHPESVLHFPVNPDSRTDDSQELLAELDFSHQFEPVKQHGSFRKKIKEFGRLTSDPVRRRLSSLSSKGLAPAGEHGRTPSESSALDSVQRVRRHSSTNSASSSNAGSKEKKSSRTMEGDSESPSSSANSSPVSVRKRLQSLTSRNSIHLPFRHSRVVSDTPTTLSSLTPTTSSPPTMPERGSPSSSRYSTLNSASDSPSHPQHNHSVRKRIKSLLHIGHAHDQRSVSTPNVSSALGMSAARVALSYNPHGHPKESEDSAREASPHSQPQPQETQKDGDDHHQNVSHISRTREATTSSIDSSDVVPQTPASNMDNSLVAIVDGSDDARSVVQHVAESKGKDLHETEVTLPDETVPAITVTLPTHSAVAESELEEKTLAIQNIPEPVVDSTVVDVSDKREPEESLSEAVTLDSSPETLGSETVVIPDLVPVEEPVSLVTAPSSSIVEPTPSSPLLPISEPSITSPEVVDAPAIHEEESEDVARSVVDTSSEDATKSDATEEEQISDPVPIPSSPSPKHVDVPEVAAVEEQSASETVSPTLVTESLPVVSDIVSVVDPDVVAVEEPTTSGTAASIAPAESIPGPSVAEPTVVSEVAATEETVVESSTSSPEPSSLTSDTDAEIPAVKEQNASMSTSSDVDSTPSSPVLSSPQPTTTSIPTITKAEIVHDEMVEDHSNVAHSEVDLPPVDGSEELVEEQTSESVISTLPPVKDVVSELSTEENVTPSVFVSDPLPAVSEAVVIPEATVVTVEEPITSATDIPDSGSIPVQLPIAPLVVDAQPVVLEEAVTDSAVVARSVADQSSADATVDEDHEEERISESVISPPSTSQTPETITVPEVVEEDSSTSLTANPTVEIDTTTSSPVEPQDAGEEKMEDDLRTSETVGDASRDDAPEEQVEEQASESVIPTSSPESNVVHETEEKKEDSASLAESVVDVSASEEPEEEQTPESAISTPSVEVTTPLNVSATAESVTSTTSPVLTSESWLVASDSNPISVPEVVVVEEPTIALPSAAVDQAPSEHSLSAAVIEVPMVGEEKAEDAADVARPVIESSSADVTAGKEHEEESSSEAGSPTSPPETDVVAEVALSAASEVPTIEGSATAVATSATYEPEPEPSEATVVPEATAVEESTISSTIVPTLSSESSPTVTDAVTAVEPEVVPVVEGPTNLVTPSTTVEIESKATSPLLPPSTSLPTSSTSSTWKETLDSYNPSQRVEDVDLPTTQNEKNKSVVKKNASVNLEGVREGVEVATIGMALFGISCLVIRFCFWGMRSAIFTGRVVS